MAIEPLSKYILPTSATMVGVCMTSIGLVKIIEAHIGPSQVDEYLSLNSLLFLTSAVLAYLSLRMGAGRKITNLLERIADICFMFGLCILVVIGVLFAYETI